MNFTLYSKKKNNFNPPKINPLTLKKTYYDIESCSNYKNQRR
jgi:hypothetical protein